MNFLNITKILFAKHYLAIILALVVGLISVAPEALGILSLGKNYQGIPFYKVNDNLFYAAKIQDILDGHLRANSPALYEYKNSASLILPIGEYIYALPAKLLNIPATQILVFYKFLLPVILFILTYILAINLSLRGESFANKINAIAAALFITLGNDLINLKNSWLLITGQMHSFITLGWTRPVNPITGGIFLFIFLILLWKIINQEKWYLPVSAGILLALMLFYFFSWGVGLAVTAVLSIIYFIKKEYKIFKKLAIIIFISFIASFLYWYNLFLTINSTYGKQIASNSGLLYFHTPLINKVLLASLIIFLPCFIYEYVIQKRQNKNLDNWWWFCLALFAGGLLALNQQVITGRTVWPYHFTQYTVPLAIIALIMLFYNFIKPKFHWLWQTVVMIIIIFSLAYGVASGRSSFYENFVFKNLQNYGLIMNWLNKNASIDCVVLTIDKEDDKTSPLEKLIPAMTHCNVYTTGWLPLGPIPPERILHNYLIELRLKGVSKEEIDIYLLNHQDEVRGYFFEDMSMVNAATYESNNQYILKKINEIAVFYKELIKNDFSGELSKYRLDYIISEGELRQNIKDILPNIKFMDKLNNICLYQF